MTPMDTSSHQERSPASTRRLTRRAVGLALVAATAVTGVVLLVQQTSRGAPAAAAAPGGTSSIIGGEDAPDDQFPWMVSVSSTKKEKYGKPGHQCGASLIAPDTVLTAAHCCLDEDDTGKLNDMTDITTMEVTIGAYNLSLADSGGTVGWTPERRSVAAAIIHPDFNPDTIFNDLCILKLSTPSTLPPVKLADAPPKIGSPVTAIGWGETEAQPATEDWKNCVWVSVFPEARCSVWGEMPGDEARVLASAACLSSCA